MYSGHVPAVDSVHPETVYLFGKQAALGPLPSARVPGFHMKLSAINSHSSRCFPCLLLIADGMSLKTSVYG